MSQNKLKLTITRDTNNGWYKVEMLDMYNNYCCVYEPSVSMSMNYAENWFAEAEKRYKANQVHAKAVHTMIQMEKQRKANNPPAAWPNNNRDGLD